MPSHFPGCNECKERFSRACCAVQKEGFLPFSLLPCQAPFLHMCDNIAVSRKSCEGCRGIFFSPEFRHFVQPTIFFACSRGTARLIFLVFPRIGPSRSSVLT